jgi:hypothetical protein
MMIKKGVNPAGIRPELLVALIVANGVWAKHGEELVVTSLNDSKHSKTSLHYAGQGADLRTRYFSNEEAEEVAQDLRDALGNSPDYDIIVESNHIHMEWQPKRRD